MKRETELEQLDSYCTGHVPVQKLRVDIRKRYLNRSQIANREQSGRTAAMQQRSLDRRDHVPVTLPTLKFLGGKE